MVQKMTQQNTKNKQMLGSKMGPKMGQDRQAHPGKDLDGGFRKALVPKMAQDGLK